MTKRRAVILSRTLALGVILLSFIISSIDPPFSQAAAAAWKTFPATGGAGMIPVPADYDGDGFSDLAYYDPATGDWRYISSQDGFKSGSRRPLSGFQIPRARPAPGDYDGDGADDPALIFDNGVRLTLAYRSSRVGMIYYQNFPINAAAYTVLVADVDGDGSADPLVYNPLSGVVVGLQSSRRFSATPGQFFQLNTGIFGGKVFVVDYDNGKADPNATSDPVYPRGRDFMNDLALLTPGGNIYIITSHYGAYDHSAVVTGFAQRDDRPVQGDFDGDSILDITVYRPGVGGEEAQFRALLSSQSFSLDRILSYTLGSSAAPYNDIPVPGRYDLDAKTDFAVYRQGQAGPGEWRVHFSELGANGLNAPPSTYPSARYGLAMANWDDSQKICYENELGVADSSEDDDTYAAGAVIPCSNEMFYDAHGIAEMAASFTQASVSYRLHPHALNVTWGNYLDPRANATMFMFKYMATTTTLSEVNRRTFLTYAHDSPGAIQVEFDLNRCNPDNNGKCQGADGGRRLIFTDGSAIWQRGQLKQWLIENRQGPVGDYRRWYYFLVGSEMDYYAKTSAPMYARILRDYTRFLVEVRDTIKQDYGITVRPIFVLSSAAMGCYYRQAQRLVECLHSNRAEGDTRPTWPTTAEYYTALLKLMTRPVDIDYDSDGRFTAEFETWTPTDVSNFLDFFHYYSLDPFLNQPITGDRLLGQSGQPQLAHLDEYATKFADEIRTTAQRFYELPGCWNAFTQRYEACRRDTLLPQFGSRYFGFKGQGWISNLCPTTPPNRVCDDDDRYPFDDVRFNALYVNARETQVTMRELDRNPGHVVGWAYWQGADELRAKDPVSGKMWGSLEGGMEPVLDWDLDCLAGLCQKVNVRFTPLGQTYFAAAAGNYTLKPDNFTYVGNNDGVSGTMTLPLTRPAWWP